MQPTHAVTWYREPWPWLLMLMPAIALVGGVFTFWLAATTNHALVVDDYYHAGKAINLEIARDQAARAHRIGASVSIGDDRASVRLSAADGVSLPEQVELVLLHPTLSGQDRRLLLSASGGGLYVAALGQGLPAAPHWRVQVMADDWRLVGDTRGWATPLNLGAAR